MTASATCEVTGLAKRFGGLRVFTDVDLTVSSGTIVGLIGPNGAGKSTILHCISGFQRPDAGRITFDGQSVLGRSPDGLCRAGIARTFQHPNLLGSDTVLRNVMVGTHCRGQARLVGAVWRSRGVREEESRLSGLAMDQLGLLGCANLAEVPAQALTAGQQRLVSVARALAGSPRLLLLDEPAAGLNEVETAALAHSLREVAASGVGLLLVEHDMALVMAVCERLVVLADGGIIAEGDPTAVRDQPQVIGAYLGVGANGGADGTDG